MVGTLQSLPPEPSTAYRDAADGWRPCDVTACALHCILAVVHVSPRARAPADPAAQADCSIGSAPAAFHRSRKPESWGPMAQQRTLLALAVWVSVGHLSALPSCTARSEQSDCLLMLGLHRYMHRKQRTWRVALLQTRRPRQQLCQGLGRAFASGSSRSCAAEHYMSTARYWHWTLAARGGRLLSRRRVAGKGQRTGDRHMSS